MLWKKNLKINRWKSGALRVTRFRKPETTMGRWQQMQPICSPSLKMWEIHTVLFSGGGGGGAKEDN
jgi:hypothetical protein